MPQLPIQAPLVTQNGNIHPVWADWFKHARVRIGGNIGLTNTELSAKFPVQSSDIADSSVTGSKIAAGVIDLTKLSSLVAQSLLPTGSFVPFGGTAAPSGYLMCDGSAVSRTTYSALYAVIGNAFGSGDGSTTFNVPDFRGRFLRGVDGTAGNDPDKSSRTAMNPGGNTGNNVGSVQGDQYASHAHSVLYSGTAAIGTGTTTAVGSGSSTTGASGGSETRPKNSYANFIIKT